MLDWGLVPYGEARARQRELAAERGPAAPRIGSSWEHPPVSPWGAAGETAPADSRGGPDHGRVPVFRVERGGQATLHAPGQVVAYPIVGLRAGELHEFLADLLAAGAAVARAYGLAAVTPPGRPGLWVGGAKLLSVGLAVQGGVSLHGLALNVNNDLALFAAIVPCGHPGERLTSLAASWAAPWTGRGQARLADESGPGWPAPGAATRPGCGGRRRTRRPSRPWRNAWPAWACHTVCQEAHCPNLGECFGRGYRHFLILGPRCTGPAPSARWKREPPPSRPEEPARVARAAPPWDQARGGDLHHPRHWPTAGPATSRGSWPRCGRPCPAPGGRC